MKQETEQFLTNQGLWNYADNIKMSRNKLAELLEEYSCALLSDKEAEIERLTNENKRLQSLLDRDRAPDLPFRVGKKQKRTIIDATGHEIGIFKTGSEKEAQAYCDYLNLATGKETDTNTNN